MTLQQLATALGLGKSTVSYALRGSPMVSAKTQEFVQRRARELGYVPNPVASAFLQQVRSKGSKRYRANLAFLSPFHQDSAFLTRLWEGARERAQELGYGIDVVPVAEYDSETLTRLLLARGVLGVISGPLGRAIGHISLDWSKFACAAYGYSMARPAMHRVVHHHLQGIRTAFRMCRRKGFRRIGLALPDESDARSNGQWSSGYLGIQQRLPDSERVAPYLTTLARYSPEKIRRWINERKPDVLILHTMWCLPDLADVLKDLPWQIPCVLLDRKPDDAQAGIDQRFVLCGRLLSDSLSAQILHNQRGLPETPIISMVDGLWVDHPSLARPPA